MGLLPTCSREPMTLGWRGFHDIQGDRGARGILSSQTLFVSDLAVLQAKFQRPNVPSRFGSQRDSTRGINRAKDDDLAATPHVVYPAVAPPWTTWKSSHLFWVFYPESDIFSSSYTIVKDMLYTPLVGRESRCHVHGIERPGGLKQEGRLDGGPPPVGVVVPGLSRIPFKAHGKLADFHPIVRGGDPLEAQSCPAPTEIRLGRHPESHLWKHCDWRRSEGVGEDLHWKLRFWEGISRNRPIGQPLRIWARNSGALSKVVLGSCAKFRVGMVSDVVKYEDSEGKVQFSRQLEQRGHSIQTSPPPLHDVKWGYVIVAPLLVAQEQVLRSQLVSFL